MDRTGYNYFAGADTSRSRLEFLTPGTRSVFTTFEAERGNPFVERLVNTPGSLLMMSNHVEPGSPNPVSKNVGAAQAYGNKPTFRELPFGNFGVREHGKVGAFYQPGGHNVWYVGTGNATKSGLDSDQLNTYVAGDDPRVFAEVERSLSSIAHGQVPTSGKYLFWTGPRGDNKAASELLSIIGNKNDHNALYFASPTITDSQVIQTILGKAHQGDQVYIGLGGVTPMDRSNNQKAYKAFTAAGLPNLHVSWHNGPEHFNMLAQGTISGRGSMRASMGATHGYSTEAYLILRDNAMVAADARQRIASAHGFPATPGAANTHLSGSGGSAVPGAYDRYGRFMYAFTPAWRLPGAAKDWQLMVDTNEIFDHETFRQAQYIAGTQGGYRSPYATQGRFFTHIYLEEKAWKLKGREIDPNTPIPRSVQLMDQAVQAPTPMELWQGEARLMFGERVSQLLEQRGNRGPLGTVLVNMGRIADKMVFARTYNRFMTSGIYRDREPHEQDGFFSGASEWLANNLTNVGMGIATFHSGQLLAETWGKSLTKAGRFITDMEEIARTHEANMLASGHMGPGRYMAWGAARMMGAVAQTRNLAFITQSELARQINHQVGKVAEAISGDVGVNHKLALDQILSKDQYFNVEIHNTHADAVAAQAARTRMVAGSVYQIANGKWALEYTSSLTPMVYENRAHLMSQHMRTYATGLGGGVGGFLDIVSPAIHDDTVLARQERWAAYKALLRGDTEAFGIHATRAGEAFERSRSMARVYGEYGGGPSRATRAAVIGSLVTFGVADYLLGQLTTSRPATLEMQVNTIADTVRAKVDDPKTQVSYLGFNYGNPFRPGRDVFAAVPGIYASGAYALGWGAEFHVSMFRQAPVETMAVYAGAMASGLVAYGAMSRKLEGLGTAYHDSLYRNRPQALGRAVAYRGRGVWAAAAALFAGTGILAAGALSLRDQVTKSMNYASHLLQTPTQAGQASAIALHYEAHWDGQWTPRSIFNAVSDLVAANAKNTMMGLKASDEKFTWRTAGKRTATAMAQMEANRQAGAQGLTEAQRNFMLDRSENYGTVKEQSEITTSPTLVARVGDLRNFGMDLVALSSGSKTTFMISVISPMPLSFMAGTKLPVYYDSHRSQQFDKWLDSDKPDPQWFDQLLSRGLVKTGGRNGWLANATRELMNWGYEGGSPWENLIRVQSQLYSVAMGFATDPVMSAAGLGLLVGGSAYGSYQASGGAARGTVAQRFSRWWETGADAEMSWDPMRNAGNMAFHRGGPIGGPVRLLTRIAASVTTMFTDMPGRMVSVVGMARDVGAHTAARMAQEHLGSTDVRWARWETLNYREGTIGKISRAGKLTGRGATLGMMAYIGYEWAKANNRESMERRGFWEEVEIGRRRIQNTGIPFVSRVAANFYSKIINAASDTHNPKWAVTRFQLTPQGTLEGVEMNPIAGQIQPGWNGWREALWSGLGRLTHDVSAEGTQTGMITTGQSGFDLYMRIVGDKISWDSPAVRFDPVMGQSAFKANLTMHPVHKGKGDTMEDLMMAMALGGSMAQISGRFAGRQRPAFMGKMFLNPGMKGSSGVYDADPIIKLALQQRFGASQAALAAHPSEMFYYFGDYDKGRLAGAAHGRYNKIETWKPGQKVKNTDWITYFMQRTDGDGKTMSQFTWGIHNISVADNQLTVHKAFEAAVAVGNEMYSQLGLDKHAGGTLLGTRSQVGNGMVEGHSDVERLQALQSSYKQMYDRGYSSPVMEDNDAAFMSAPDQDQPELLKLPTAMHTPVDFRMNWLNSYSGNKTSLALWALVAGTPGLAVAGAGVYALMRRFGGSEDDNFSNRLNRYRRQRYGRTRGTFTRPVRGSGRMWSMSHQGVGLAELDLPIGGEAHSHRSIRFGDHMARPFTDLLDHTGAVSISAEQKANFYRKVWHNIGHIYEGLESTRDSHTLLRSVEMLDEELLKLDMGAHGASPPPGWQRSAVLDRLRGDLTRLHGDLTATHAAHGGSSHPVIRVASNGNLHPNEFMRRFEQIVQDSLYRFDKAANLRQVEFEPLQRRAGLRGLFGSVQAVKTWTLIDDPNYMPPPMLRTTPPYGSPLIDFAQRNDLGPGMGRVRSGYHGVGLKGAWQGSMGVLGGAMKGLGLVLTPASWLANTLMGFGITTGLVAAATDEKDPVYGGEVRKNAIAFGQDTATSLGEMFAIQQAGTALVALSAPVAAFGGPIGLVGGALAFMGGTAAMVGPMLWAGSANTLRPEMRKGYYGRGNGVHVKNWQDAAYLADRAMSRMAQRLFEATSEAVKNRPDWSQSARDVFGALLHSNANASNILRQWAYNASKKSTHDVGSQAEQHLARFVSDNFDAITPLGKVMPWVIDMTNTSFSQSATWSSESPIWWGPNSALQHPDGGRMDWIKDAWNSVEKPKQLHMMMSADPLGSSMYEMVAHETLGMESGSNASLMNLNFRAQYEMKGEGTGGFGNASAGRAFRFRPIQTVDHIIEGELQRRAIMHEMAVIGGGIATKMYMGWGGYETHRGKRWIDNGTAVGPGGSTGPQGPGPASAGWYKDLTKADLPVLHQAIESATGILRGYRGPSGVEASALPFVKKWASYYHVPEGAVKATIMVETGGTGRNFPYPNGSGAIGYMQIVPGPGGSWHPLHPELGDTSYADPSTNIRLGTEYLRNNYDQIKKASIKAGYKLDDTTLWTMAAAAHQTGLSQPNTLSYFMRGQFAPMSDSNESNAAYGQQWLKYYTAGGKASVFDQGVSALPPAERERARKALLEGAKHFFSGAGGSVDKLVDNSLIWVPKGQREQVKEAIRTGLFEQKYWLSHDKPSTWSNRAPGTLGIHPTDKQRAYLLGQAASTVLHINLEGGLPAGTHKETLPTGESMVIADGYHLVARTSGFGPRVQPTTGATTDHHGYDLIIGKWDKTGNVLSVQGSPIMARDSGKVIYSGWFSGYGKTVLVELPDHTRELYGHLTDLTVAAGTTVSRGTMIGHLGSTGVVTGPHLHFETRTADGTAFDPMRQMNNHEIITQLDPDVQGALGRLEQLISASRPKRLSAFASGFPNPFSVQGPWAAGPEWKPDYAGMLMSDPLMQKKGITRKKADDIVALFGTLRSDLGMTNVDDPFGVPGDPTSRPKHLKDLPLDDKDDHYWRDLGLMVLGGVALAGAGLALTRRWHNAGKAATRTGGGGWWNGKGPSGPPSSGPSPRGPRPGPAPMPGSGALYTAFWATLHGHNVGTALGRAWQAPGTYARTAAWSLGEAFRGLGRSLHNTRLNGFRFDFGLRSWAQHQRRTWDYTMMWYGNDLRTLFAGAQFQAPSLDWHHPNWQAGSGWMSNLASSMRATRQNFHQSLFDMATHGVYGTARAIGATLNGIARVRAGINHAAARGRENLRLANEWDRQTITDAYQAVREWWLPRQHPIENHPWTDAGAQRGPAEPGVTSQRPAHADPYGYNTRLNATAWQRLLRRVTADWVWDAQAEQFRPESLGSRLGRNTRSAGAWGGRMAVAGARGAARGVWGGLKAAGSRVWDVAGYNFTYGIGFIHDGVLRDLTAPFRVPGRVYRAARGLYNRMRTRNTTHTDPISDDYQRTQRQAQLRGPYALRVGATGTHTFGGSVHAHPITGTGGYGQPEVSGGPAVPGVPGLWVQTPHDEQWSDPKGPGLPQGLMQRRVRAYANMRPGTHAAPYINPQRGIDQALLNMGDIGLEMEAFGNYLNQLVSSLSPGRRRGFTNQAPMTGQRFALAPGPEGGPRRMPRGARRGSIINPAHVMYELGRLAVQGLRRAYTAFTGLFSTHVLNNISGVRVPTRRFVDGVFHSGETTPYNSFSYRHEHTRWTTSQPFFPSVITDPDHYHLHYNRDVYQNKSKLYWSPVRGRTGREPGLVPRADILEALVAAEAHDLAHGYGPALSPTLIRGTNSPAARLNRMLNGTLALPARTPKRYKVKGTYRPGRGQWMTDQRHTVLSVSDDDGSEVWRTAGRRGDYARAALRQVSHRDEDNYGSYSDGYVEDDSRLYVFPRRTKFRRQQQWNWDVIYAGPVPTPAAREIRPGMFRGILFSPSGGDDEHKALMAATAGHGDWARMPLTVHRKLNLQDPSQARFLRNNLKRVMGLNVFQHFIDNPKLVLRADHKGRRPLVQIREAFNALALNYGSHDTALQAITWRPGSGESYALYSKSLGGTPSGKGALVQLDPQQAVMGSTLAQLGPRYLRAAMAHELGHVIDFTSGGGMTREQMNDPEFLNGSEVRAWTYAGRYLGVQLPALRQATLATRGIVEPLVHQMTSGRYKGRFALAGSLQFEAYNLGAASLRGARLGSRTSRPRLVPAAPIKVLPSPSGNKLWRVGNAKIGRAGETRVVPTELEVNPFNTEQQHTSFEYTTNHIRIRGYVNTEGELFTSMTAKDGSPHENAYRSGLLRLLRRLEQEHGLKVTSQRGSSLPAGYAAKEKFWGDRFWAENSEWGRGKTMLELAPRTTSYQPVSAAGRELFAMGESLRETAGVLQATARKRAYLEHRALNPRTLPTTEMVDMVSETTERDPWVSRFSQLASTRTFAERMLDQLTDRNLPVHTRLASGIALKAVTVAKGVARFLPPGFGRPGMPTGGDDWSALPEPIKHMPLQSESTALVVRGKSLRDLLYDYATDARNGSQHNETARTLLRATPPEILEQADRWLREQSPLGSWNVLGSGIEAVVIDIGGGRAARLNLGKMPTFHFSPHVNPVLNTRQYYFGDRSGKSSRALLQYNLNLQISEKLDMSHLMYDHDARYALVNEVERNLNQQGLFFNDPHPGNIGRSRSGGWKALDFNSVTSTNMGGIMDFERWMGSNYGPWVSRPRWPERTAAEKVLQRAEWRAHLRKKWADPNVVNVLPQRHPYVIDLAMPGYKPTLGQRLKGAVQRFLPPGFGRPGMATGGDDWVPMPEATASSRRLPEPIRYMPLQGQVDFVLVGQGRLNPYGRYEFDSNRDHRDEQRWNREIYEAELREEARRDPFMAQFDDRTKFWQRTQAFVSNPARQLPGAVDIMSREEFMAHVPGREPAFVSITERLKTRNFKNLGKELGYRMSQLASRLIAEPFVNNLRFEISGMLGANGVPAVEWRDLTDEDALGLSHKGRVTLDPILQNRALAQTVDILAHEIQHYADEHGATRTLDLGKLDAETARASQWALIWGQYYRQWRKRTPKGDTTHLEATVRQVEEWARPTELNAWPLGWAFAKYYMHPSRVVQNVLRTMTYDRVRLKENGAKYHQKFIDQYMRDRVRGDLGHLGTLFGDPDTDENPRPRFRATDAFTHPTFGRARRVFTTLGAQVLGRIVVHDVARMLGIRHGSLPAFKIVWDPKKEARAHYDSTKNLIEVNLAHATSLTDFIESVAHETVHRGSHYGSARTVRMHEDTRFYEDARTATLTAEDVYGKLAREDFPHHPEAQEEYIYEELTAQYFGKAYARTGWLRRFFGIGRRLFMRQHLGRQGQNSWFERTGTAYEGQRYQRSTNMQGEFVTPFNNNPTTLDVTDDIFSSDRLVRYETNHILITGEISGDTFHTSWVSKGDASGKGLYRAALLRMFKRLSEGYGVEIRQQYGESLLPGKLSKMRQWGDRFRVGEQIEEDAWQTEIDLSPRSRMPIGLDPRVQAEVSELYQIAEQARTLNARRVARLEEKYNAYNPLPAEEMIAGLDSFFAGLGANVSTPQQRALDALEAGRITRGGGLRLLAGQDTLTALVPSGTIPTVDAEFVGYEHTAIVPLNSNRSSEGPTIDVTHNTTTVTQTRPVSMFNRVGNALNNGMMGLMVGADLYSLFTARTRDERGQAAQGLVTSGMFIGLQAGSAMAQARGLSSLEAGLGLGGMALGVGLGVMQTLSAGQAMLRAPAFSPEYYQAKASGWLGVASVASMAAGPLAPFAFAGIAVTGLVFNAQFAASAERTARYSTLATLAQNQNLQLNQLGLALPQMRQGLRTVVRRDVNRDFESLQVGILPSQLATATPRDRARYVEENMRQLSPQIEREVIREKQIAEAQIKRQYQEDKRRVDPSQTVVPYRAADESASADFDLPDVSARGPGGMPLGPRPVKTVIVETPKAPPKQGHVDTPKPAGPRGKVPHVVATGPDGKPVLKPLKFPKAPVDTTPRGTGGGKNGQIDSAGYR